MKKKNRAKLAVVLSAAMLISALPSVAFAESATSPSRDVASVPGTGGQLGGQNGAAQIKTTVTKEKAETLARQYVSIPKEYTLQGARLSTDMIVGGKRTSWNLEFVKKTKGKHVGNISVSIHADSGQLLAFYTYVNDPGAKPSYPLKVDRTEAGQVALSFIGEVGAEYKDQIALNLDYGVQVLPPLTGQVVHSLRYDRIVNDIPYVDNYIQLEVNSEGHVLSYQLRWDEQVKFPKADSRLTAAQADAKLRAAAEPKLSYIIPYSAQGEKKPFLSYQLQPIAVDAITGELKNNDSDWGYLSNSIISKTPVSSAPLGEKPKSAALTEQQALDAAKAVLKLPAQSELVSSHYTEDYSEDGISSKAIWNFSWTTKKEKVEISHAYATVDAQTGTVQNFYQYNSQETEAGKPVVTQDKAAETAVELVKKQLPWLTDELYLVKPDPEQFKEEAPRTYHVNFLHVVDGAEVSYDRIQVGVDLLTGDVQSFEAHIVDIAYPAQAPAIISKEAAIDSWLTYYRTQLTYRLVHNYTWNGQPIPIEKYNLIVASGDIGNGELKSDTTAELVYRLVPRLIEENVVLDAETGKWKNRDTGEVTQLEKPKAADIEGHWAQRQLELMVAYKALDVKDGKVNPNATITRGELIKMLVLARNSGRLYGFASNDMANETASFADVDKGSSYFAYVESALQENLIDLGDGSFNPEGKVSRDDMAELIVRALGYNTLANYDDLFHISFTDADKVVHKGQASIVVGLKIMNLTGGKFNPAKEVTRAEAASAFFRYLQTRAELQEAPIRM